MVCSTGLRNIGEFPQARGQKPDLHGVRPSEQSHLMNARGLRVVIAGGGVAGLEALLGLRDLAAERVQLQLLSPGEEFVYRPLEVLEPFYPRAMVRIPWSRITADLGVTLVRSALQEVDLDANRVRTTTAGELSFDVLVVAAGGSPRPAIARAITVGAHGATARLRHLLQELTTGKIKRVGFIVPPGVTWTLPLYELALLTARFARRAEKEAELFIATAEAEPLGLFGKGAGEAVRQLLEASSIRLRTDGLLERRVGERTWLELPPGPPPDAIVAMPRLAGPYLRGLPADEEGFLLVDERGRVSGETDVYAAGDVTSFPVKQGGLATQQADTVAAHIARRAGAEVEPAPFEPMLRAMLLTGEAPRYLRIALTAAASAPELGREPPWWPPVKIVGRYLAPYLGIHSGWASDG
jgi:sulfide:quinone oxidoreductase